MAGPVWSVPDDLGRVLPPRRGGLEDRLGAAASSPFCTVVSQGLCLASLHQGSQTY